MSVGLEPARGRKRPAELNLVPFIDLLTVCITFLVATAVWVELASVPVDQPPAARGGDGLPSSLLTVHLAADGVKVGRDVGILVPRVGGDIDWAAVADRIASDRDAHPEERAVRVVADDGLPYGDVIHALDLTAAQANRWPFLGDGAN